MNETLVVLMMILSPVAGSGTSVTYSWKPAGYFQNKEDCEQMASKMYSAQSTLADRFKQKGIDANISGSIAGHICGNATKRR